MSEVQLPIGGAELDPTNPPGVDFAGGRRKLLFDDTTDEIVRWSFVVPDNFSSSPSVELFFSMASATANDIAMGVAVYAITPGDAQDADADSYDTVNHATTVVPGTAGHIKKLTVTLTNNDSMAAGDKVWFEVRRDADQTSGAGNDDATGDLELWGARFLYTAA